MTLHPLKMPKWGLSMEEGRIVDWLVEEGDEVSSGAGVVEVETDKILAAVEVQDSGVLRRRVAGKGDVVPVGGLLAVLTDTETADSEIDGFIEKFRAKVVSPEGGCASSDGRNRENTSERPHYSISEPGAGK